MLNEARSHPELNPKTTPLDQLRALREQHGHGLYVSFTAGMKKKGQRSPDIGKLGINPRSDFKTPMGIYAYPIDLVIDFTESMFETGINNLIDDSGGLEAPFTGNHPWQKAWVFHVDSDDAFTPNITADDYSNAVHDLADYFEDADEFRELILFAQETAREKTLYSYLWNLTRLVAQELNQRKNAAGKSLPNGQIVSWNAVMRTLGYTVAIDPGLGFIHDNEETQAVIFDPRIISVVGSIKRDESAAMLFGKLKQRLQSDALLLDKIPINTVSRIPQAMANQMLITYAENHGDLGKAVDFINAHPQRLQMIPYFAKQYDKKLRTIAFAAYRPDEDYMAAKAFSPFALDRLIEETDIKIDSSLEGALLRGLMQQDPTSVQLTIDLLDKPNRLKDYDRFLSSLGHFVTKGNDPVHNLIKQKVDAIRGAH